MMDCKSNFKTTLESQITDLAKALEIDAIGFSPLGTVEASTQKYFSDWLAKGHHGSMSYLQSHLPLRINPSELLDGAKSVIVIAISYYPKERQASSAPQIAKYALGRDYHKVIRNLLHQLGKKIHDQVAPHEYRALVDTAPFFERYWAEQSGIGFIGRHHNFIVPKVGSFLFLGELITTLELQSTAPVMSQKCGSCQRCIEACPTKALTPDSLDARRCINYLTIEHQGEIDRELSQFFGHRLYGCDTCQDVCPYNQYPRISRHFSPALHLLDLNRQDLLEFSEEKYAQFFYGTPCIRAKYAGMQRNVKLYLANHLSESTSLSK